MLSCIPVTVTTDVPSFILLPCESTAFVGSDLKSSSRRSRSRLIEEFGASLIVATYEGVGSDQRALMAEFASSRAFTIIPEGEETSVTIADGILKLICESNDSSGDDSA